MFSKINTRTFKWVTIVGALVNLFISILFFVTLYNSISGIEGLNSINGGVNEVQYKLHSYYSILINATSISILFSLLLISISVRIDQFFVRLKWVNIVCGALTIITLASILIISNRYTDSLIIKVNNPLLYIITIIDIILISIDQIRLSIKYKNNPFYHGGKYKNTSSKYNYRYNHSNDGYINPRPREEEKVVDESQVIDSNMSYFEMYEKRKEELDKIEEEFDQGKISEKEYQLKRKAVYAKYDRYN